LPGCFGPRGSAGTRHTHRPTPRPAPPGNQQPGRRQHSPPDHPSIPAPRPPSAFDARSRRMAASVSNCFKRPQKPPFREADAPRNGQASAASEHLGERRSRAHFLDSAAMIALVEGDLGGAWRFITEAAEAATGMAEPSLLAGAALHRALAALAAGDIPAA